MRNRIVAAIASAVAILPLALGLSATAAHAAPGVPCGPAAKACLDLSTQQAWLMDNGAVTYGPVPVASGKSGYATPSGTFHVLSKNAHFWSTAFNAPMPYSVFFYPGMAFHEGSVHVKSHGCVHLTPAAAVEFFDTLHVGDVVQIVP